MDYDKVTTAIKEIEGVIKSLNYQIKKGNIDKVGIQFSGTNGWDKPTIIPSDNFSYATIKFDALHGCFGNSSCYDDMSEELARYILLAIIKNRSAIIESAINIANEEKRNIAKEAKDEAKKILDICSGESA